MADNPQSIKDRRYAYKMQLEEEKISSSCLKIYLIEQRVITAMITSVKGETLSSLALLINWFINVSKLMVMQMENALKYPGNDMFMSPGFFKIPI